MRAWSHKVFDVLLVGGGLANGLIAFYLKKFRPDIDFLMIERDHRLGGEHTWSFHDSDLEVAKGRYLHWITPLISCRWPRYDVLFPNLKRSVAKSYSSIRAKDFHSRLSRLLGERLRTGTFVKRLLPNGAQLADGERIHARIVVDGRGLSGRMFPRCAYQKFHGLQVETACAHPWRVPVLMDATVKQDDGFHFVYILPWSSRSFLIEDTYYSDRPDLDLDRTMDLLTGYLTQRAPGIRRGDWWVTSQEKGILPIPLYGAEKPPCHTKIVCSGVRAGLFHPTTGYSFAEAVAFAEFFGSLAHFDPEFVLRETSAYTTSVWRRGGFLRRLNNMLFMAATPTARWRVLERFYGFREDLIGRFYRGQLSHLDRLRLLSGKPPVAITKGVRTFFSRVTA